MSWLNTVKECVCSGEFEKLKELLDAPADGITQQDLDDALAALNLLEQCAAQAIVEPPALTFIAPQIHRRGENGVDTDVARCDHTHDHRRINPTPLTPVPTFSGTGTMPANIVLDRWSDDHEVEFAWRAQVTQPAGAGWGFITIPNIAGFQRPIITLEGTYRPPSTAIQIDTDVINNQGNVGAGPRGPYMGQEAHHWSSTQRIYIGYYRRDNPITSMYIDYRARYICL